MANIDRECHRLISSTVEITEQNMKFEQFIQKQMTVYQVLIPISSFENLGKYTKNIKKQSLSVEFNKTCLAGFLLLKYTSLNLRKYGI